MVPWHWWQWVHCTIIYVSSRHYPNVVAIAKQLSGGSVTHEHQLVASADSCCAPAYAFIKATFDNELKLTFLLLRVHVISHQWRWMNCCRYWSLSIFLFLNSGLISILKSELPDYLLEAEGISDQVNALHWMKTHEESYPTGLTCVSWFY